MAKGDIVLTRKEHRDLVRRLQEIRMHHTNRMEDGVLVQGFPHDDDLHEETDGNDPQCIVIRHCMEAERLIAEKLNGGA